MKADLYAMAVLRAVAGWLLFCSGYEYVRMGCAYCVIVGVGAAVVIGVGVHIRIRSVLASVAHAEEVLGLAEQFAEASRAVDFEHPHTVLSASMARSALIKRVQRDGG